MGVRPGPNASGASANYANSATDTPPAFRKPSAREVSSFLQAQCQTGPPSTMNTDAPSGPSVMARQSSYIATNLREAGEFPLIRFAGTASSAYAAPPTPRTARNVLFAMLDAAHTRGHAALVLRVRFRPVKITGFSLVDGSWAIGAPAIGCRQLRAPLWPGIAKLGLGSASTLYAGAWTPCTRDALGSSLACVRYFQIPTPTPAPPAPERNVVAKGPLRRPRGGDANVVAKPGPPPPVTPPAYTPWGPTQPGPKVPEIYLSFAFVFACTLPVGAIDIRLIRERVPAARDSPTYAIAHSRI